MQGNIGFRGVGKAIEAIRSWPLSGNVGKRLAFGMVQAAMGLMDEFWDVVDIKLLSLVSCMLDARQEKCAAEKQRFDCGLLDRLTIGKDISQMSNSQIPQWTASEVWSGHARR